MDDKLITQRDKLARKLTGSLQGSSLDALVKAKQTERETFLVLDYSSSMSESTGYSGLRKIDVLRDVAAELLADIPCPQVGFGGYVSERDYGPVLTTDAIRFITVVPEPEGGTPLTEAIQFCQQHGAKHLVVVSDGAPDNRMTAMQAAQAFGGPIDVFYVGPDHDQVGREFLRQLATATRGQMQATSLSDPKQLTNGIRGLLSA